MGGGIQTHPHVVRISLSILGHTKIINKRLELIIDLFCPKNSEKWKKNFPLKTTEVKLFLH